MDHQKHRKTSTRSGGGPRFFLEPEKSCIYLFYAGCNSREKVYPFLKMRIVCYLDDDDDVNDIESCMLQEHLDSQ